MRPWVGVKLTFVQHLLGGLQSSSKIGLFITFAVRGSVNEIFPQLVGAFT